MMKVLLYLLTMLPALDVIGAGLYLNKAMPETCRDGDSKQDPPECKKNKQYCFNGTCCNSCSPGSFATKVGCTKSSPITSCQNCNEGKEYMDHYNYQLHCLRCGICDREHGMEVEKPCTIYQNEKCKCMPGFFCNSSQPCTHCNPCDKCEHGVIVENCTQTKNTKCARTGNSLPPWLISTIVIIVIIAVLIVVVILMYCRKKQNLMNPNRNDIKQNIIEMDPLKYPDINLSPYIPDIVEEMMLKDVKKLVRKLGVPPAHIDAITHDNQHDCSEQKIKLLEYWYQRKGEKNAYCTLIITLRSIPLNAPADKLEEKVMKM